MIFEPMEGAKAPVNDSQTNPSLSKLRLLLFALAVISCALPFLHYRLIEHNLDGVRYPWGLLPAEFLFFRWFGELSAWLPFICLAGLGWSFRCPQQTRGLLGFSTTAILLFSIAYACYALLIVWVLLKMRAG